MSRTSTAKANDTRNMSYLDSSILFRRVCFQHLIQAFITKIWKIIKFSRTRFYLISSNEYNLWWSYVVPDDLHNQRWIRDRICSLYDWEDRKPIHLDKPSPWQRHRCIRSICRTALNPHTGRLCSGSWMHRL